MNVNMKLCDLKDKLFLPFVDLIDFYTRFLGGWGVNQNRTCFHPLDPSELISSVWKLLSTLTKEEEEKKTEEK